MTGLLSDLQTQINKLRITTIAYVEVLQHLPFSPPLAGVREW